MEDIRSRGPQKTQPRMWKKDCWTQQLNKDDAMDHSK